MGTLLGWIGSACFAACGIPQAHQSIRQGNSDGISLSFLLLWLGGAIFYTLASIIEFGLVWWLLFNYAANAVCIGIIIKYYFYPRT